MSIGLCNIKEEDSTSEIIEEQVFQYSKNPFTPSGKMRRLYYFLYVTLINFVSHILDTYANKTSIYENIDQVCIVLSIVFTILTFQLFITKKRILDITNNNKKSWIFASLFVGIGTILSMINQYLVYILLPFGFYILFKEPYRTKETYLGIPEDNQENLNTIICNHCNKTVRKAKYCSNCGGQLDEVQEMQ